MLNTTTVLLACLFLDLLNYPGQNSYWLTTETAVLYEATELRFFAVQASCCFNFVISLSLQSMRCSFFRTGSDSLPSYNTMETSGTGENIARKENTEDSAHKALWLPRRVSQRLVVKLPLPSKREMLMWRDLHVGTCQDLFHRRWC